MNELLFLGPLWAVSLVLAVVITRRLQPRPLPAELLSVESETVEVEAAPEPSPRLDGDWLALKASLEFHRAAAASLASSIVRELRSTTDPLSERLVGLRGETADVASLAHGHERRMAAGEDLELVARLGADVREDMATLARLNHESNLAVEREFDDLGRRLNSVLDLSRAIEDVSARINVLSINASIEAARAGEAGRGFKVIAGEVKTLAQGTSALLDQILVNVLATTEQFSAMRADLAGKRSGISDLLARQESSFGAFRREFQTQRDGFEALSRRILSFAGRLDGEIQHLSPLVQLHDIVVQELENLAFVADDALEDWITVAGAKAAGTEAPGRLGLARRAEEARRRLTTSEELAVLGRLVSSAGLTTAPAAPVARVELF